MGMQSGDVSMTLVTRPDPDPIHAWDHLVSHTPGSDVSQLSAWSAVRGQAGFVPRYALASFGGQPFRYPPAVALLSSRLLRTGYGLFRRSATSTFQKSGNTSALNLRPGCAGAGAARGSTPPSPGGCLTQAGVATAQPPTMPHVVGWRW